MREQQRYSTTPEYCPWCDEQVVLRGPDMIAYCPDHGVVEGETLRSEADLLVRSEADLLDEQAVRERLEEYGPDIDIFDVLEALRDLGAFGAKYWIVQVKPTSEVRGSFGGYLRGLYWVGDSNWTINPQSAKLFVTRERAQHFIAHIAGPAWVTELQVFKVLFSISPTPEA